MTQCSAKSKRTKERCKAKAMANGLCYHHGGATPRGHALPQTTHGRYSKDLPTRLASRYAEAASDPDLLQLDSEIHLTDALIRDRLATLDTGESGRLWRELNAAWREFASARKAGDAAGMTVALAQIEPLINRGVADWAARQEVLDMVERRRKLVDSEGKRRVQMQQMITAERATLLISAVSDVVMRHVDDRDTRYRIAEGIRALLSVGDGGPSEP